MKKIIAALLVLLCMTGLFALEVDRKELEPGDAGNAIEFINYTGPHAVIETVEQIRGIGVALGSSLLKNGNAGDMARYYIVHAVDPSVPSGLDADILVLGSGAGVDHIDNLRRIISAYLSVAYGYSEKDSATLAKFVTVYNAVYRGKMDTFKAKYKPVVLKYLTADKAGLSVRYDEWAGRSQIVIPLSDSRLAGTISTIDTTALTGKEVVGKIKEEGPGATDTRKDMVDLKERESGAAQDRAASAQTEAVTAQTTVTEKKQELAAATTEAAAARKTAEETKKEAAAKPADTVVQQKAAEAQKTAETKNAAVEEKKQEVAQAQETATKKTEVAQADQTLAATKQKEAQTERKEIATDVQKTVDDKAVQAKKAETTALATSVPGFALRVIDENSLLSELVLVNLNDGKILKTSPLNTIRGRTLFDTGSGLIAIAGKKGGSATVKLVLVNPDTLEMTKQGADTIAEQSMLVQSVNDYYAVIEQAAGKFVVGRFDRNLDAKAKSAVNVQPYTPITVTPRGILIQDASGNMLLLRATDLVDQTAK